MKRILVLFLIICVAVFSVGCSSDKSTDNQNSYELYDYSNDSYESDSRQIETSFIEDIEEETTTDDSLTANQAISILTESGKIWYRAGRGPEIGKMGQDYCVFIDRGSYLECEEHWIDETKVMYTLTISESDKGLVLKCKTGSAYTSGTYYWKNNYWSTQYTGSNSWYLDEESFAFGTHNLSSTYI